MSFCCENCFNSAFLNNFIIKHGAINNCDYCGSCNIHCISPESLTDLFAPLYERYTQTNNFAPSHDISKGKTIDQHFNDDWNVFNFFNRDKQKALLNEMGFDTQQLFMDENTYYGYYLENEASLQAKWEYFCEEIKYKNRFFLEESLIIHNDLLKATERIIDEKISYRARISEHKLNPDEMGPPPSKTNPMGRGNPEGISYLYLASDIETAFAEVKPYINERVTIGKFEILDSLKVIDLRNPFIRDPFAYKTKLRNIINNIDILILAGKELSKPISPNKGPLEYLPSQYLCELIKSKKYDGITYKSSVANGFNLLLFSKEKTRCKETFFYKTTGINFQKEEI